MSARGRPVVVAALAMAAAASACRKTEPGGAGPAASTAPSAPPVDRLAPGELPPGTEEIYGLVLPRGMKVAARFPRVAHATGPMPPEDVANYLRSRVDVKRVELGAAGTVFPGVRFPAGAPGKSYSIEVIAAGTGTELVVRDVTPLPRAAPDPAVSDAEKWRRAGYKPDGTPLNPKELR